VLNSLSGSFQITPMFFLTYDNGVNYNLVAQPPQYNIQSIQDIEGYCADLPASGRIRTFCLMWHRSSDRARCRLSRTTTSVGSRCLRLVQERDLGAVAP